MIAPEDDGKDCFIAKTNRLRCSSIGLVLRSKEEGIRKDKVEIYKEKKHDANSEVVRQGVLDKERKKNSDVEKRKGHERI